MIRSALRVFLSAAIVLFLLTAARPSAATEAPARPAEGSTPIAWRSFEPAAFEQAKTEKKLVLLWMPAAWGHWDRIMAETTFADPRVVKLVTERFIPVRVDPLIRPDLFLRYGMGGWPTTTFLLSTGQPFFFPDAQRKVMRAGGNFYAAESLASYLENLAEYHAANHDAAEKSAEEIARGLLQRKEVGNAPLKPDLLEGATTQVMEAWEGLPPDPAVHRSRHPDVDGIELGLYYQAMRRRGREVLDVSLRVATEMARGGVRDQIGGGFHRFASDLAWRVPAFEKTLQLNAEMLQAYTDIAKLTGNALFLKVAEGIADYVKETLTDPAGWFYPWQAADARLGEDGDYYTWTLAEASEALGEAERPVTLAAFDIGEWGELVDSSPRRNVLFVQEGPRLLASRFKIPEDEATRLLDAGRAQLLAARRRRPAPPVGKILVTEPHAAMATALLALGDARNRADLREAALKAIQIALDKALVPESGLMDRAWSPETGRAGVPEIFADQVQMVRALIAAYESTGEARWLDSAKRLADAASGVFAESLEGGWMDRIYAPDAPGLLSWPMRSIRDNALFAESLLRLHHLTDEAPKGPYQKAAVGALESWADEFTKYKDSAAAFGVAADRAQTPPLEVLLAGAQGEAGDALAIKARALYHPWKLMRRVSAAQASARLAAGSKEAPKLPSEPFALLCTAGRCAGPFTREANLKEQLAAFLKLEEPPAVKETP